MNIFHSFQPKGGIIYESILSVSTNKKDTRWAISFS